MTAPYRIIKHGYRIGLQIRQLVVTKVSDNDGQRPNVVTHHYPIVTYENPEKIRTDSQLFNNHDIYEETWDVEEREVSTLCMSEDHGDGSHDPLSILHLTCDIQTDNKR